MKNFTMILCFIFAVSVGTLHSQTSQGPAATGSNDPMTGYTLTAGPSSPDAVQPESGGTPSPIGKLTMSASPNPFTARTVITCTLPGKGKLAMGVRNMFGETVRTFDLNVEQEGSQALEMTSDQLRPGIYTAMLVFKTADNVLMKAIRIVYTK